MIPVLGIPALNRPDLLRQLLRSIDVPVARLVVIDNSATGEMADAAFEVRPDVVLVEPGANIGVAASWNHIIRTAPDAPWWCLVNIDVEFAPGALAALADAMVEDCVATLAEYAAFGLTQGVVDRVGFFDENFHPVYWEDVDYRYRCAQAGIPEYPIASGTTHVGSVCYRGNHHDADLARTYPANLAYYVEKWGGPRGQERYATPFAQGGSLADWTLDRRRLAAQQWTD